MSTIADIAMNVRATEPPKIIGPQLREMARIAAAMNADRKECCTPEQKALREFFEMNERILSEVAR